MNTIILDNIKDPIVTFKHWPDIDEVIAASDVALATTKRVVFRSNTWASISVYDLRAINDIITYYQSKGVKYIAEFAGHLSITGLCFAKLMDEATFGFNINISFNYNPVWGYGDISAVESASEEQNLNKEFVYNLLLEKTDFTIEEILDYVEKKKIFSHDDLHLFGYMD